MRAVHHGTKHSRVDPEFFAALGGIGAAKAVSPRKMGEPDEVRFADVVVVGSGAAGLAAASAAAHDGARVVVLEKAAIWGGTTRRSGGVFHIYNNVLMREAGLDDPRADALKYLCRCAYPTLFNPADDRYGLPAAEFNLIAAYYDYGSDSVEALTAMGAADLTAPALESRGRAASMNTRRDGQASLGEDSAVQQPLPDYLPYEENIRPRGRGMKTKGADGLPAHGPEMVRQLRAFLDKRGAEILLRHSAAALTTDNHGAVTGVVARDPAGRSIEFKARLGVIFGSGGFTHNEYMRRHFLRAPVAGGCGIATNTGDFIGLASRCDAQLGVMSSGAWAEMIYDDASDTSNGNIDLFEIPGDSMIIVNRYGNRVVNETLNYHERSQVHHVWSQGEYPNYLLFMIYDQRTAEEYSGSNPIPPLGAVAPHVVRADTLEQLLTKLDERLEYFGRRPPNEISAGRTRIHESAPENLRRAVERFNQYAEDGVDQEFHRGELPVEWSQHEPRRKSNDRPNSLMYPISGTGPYYAVILIGVTYETRSGPTINGDGQVIDRFGDPIEGLYGAGDCVASVFGQSYPGGGANIGPALVFGYRAGRHAASRAPGGRSAPALADRRSSDDA